MVSGLSQEKLIQRWFGLSGVEGFHQMQKQLSEEDPKLQVVYREFEVGQLGFGFSVWREFVVLNSTDISAQRLLEIFQRNSYKTLWPRVVAQTPLGHKVVILTTVPDGFWNKGAAKMPLFTTVYDAPYGLHPIDIAG